LLERVKGHNPELEQTQVVRVDKGFTEVQAILDVRPGTNPVVHLSQAQSQHPQR